MVVSGAVEALDEVERLWQERGARTRRLTVSHAFHSPLMEPMLDEFRAVLDGLTFAAPALPVVSNVTGALADADEIRTADYWVRHVREAVRFADGVAALRAAGADTFLEIGPRSVLTAMAADVLPGDDGVLAVAAQRKDRPEARTALLAALAELHVHGVAVDWQPWFADTGAPAGRPAHVRVPAPALLARGRAPGGPATSPRVGLRPAHHPLLGAAVGVARRRGLPVHRAAGPRAPTRGWPTTPSSTPCCCPAPASSNWPSRPARRSAPTTSEELTLEAPLVLPETGGVDIQVWIGPAGRDRLPVRVAALRPDGEPAEGERRLDPPRQRRAGQRPGRAERPRRLVRPDHLAAAGRDRGRHRRPLPEPRRPGYDYGPAFQGAARRLAARRRRLRRGGAARGPRRRGRRFGLHPALLDAALHTLGLTTPAGEPSGADMPPGTAGCRSPGTASPCTRAGAAAARVRVSHTGPDSVSLLLADAPARPVVSVGSLVLRPVSADQLRTAGGGGTESLFRLEWAPLALPAGPSTVDWAVLGDAAALTDAVAATGTTVAAYADLTALATAMDDGTDAPGVLVVPFLDPPASADVPAGRRRGDPPGARPAPAVARRRPLRGLPAGRADPGRGRHRPGRRPDRPGRRRRVGPAPLRPVGAPRPVRAGRRRRRAPARAAALVPAVATDEPQLAIRAGVAAGARLARVPAPTEPPAAPFDADGTVLITGATGTLGALIARHLVDRARRPAPAADQPARPRPPRAPPSSCAELDGARRRASPSPPATSPTATPLAALLAGDPGRAPAHRRRPHRRRARRRRRRLARPPSGWTACCGPRSTPPGTCTS